MIIDKNRISGIERRVAEWNAVRARFPNVLVNDHGEEWSFQSAGVAEIATGIGAHPLFKSDIGVYVEIPVEMPGQHAWTVRVWDPASAHPFRVVRELKDTHAIACIMKTILGNPTVLGNPAG